MRVVIAGGNGRIARLLHPLLAARGDSPVALIRNPGHAAALGDLGAEPSVVDLESAPDAALDAALAGADAVVFAAGAGPGSGAARKLTVDRDAANRSTWRPRRTPTPTCAAATWAGRSCGPAA